MAYEATPMTPVAARGLIPKAIPISSPSCVAAWVPEEDHFEEWHADEFDDGSGPHHDFEDYGHDAPGPGPLRLAAPPPPKAPMPNAPAARPSSDFRALRRLLRKSCGELDGLRPKGAAAAGAAAKGTSVRSR